ncbi:MAG: DUF1579 domain-containing protein [Caulobacter sp.]|nr:DUF1579 domain-containing protein [Caulobacter sp.]
MRPMLAVLGFALTLAFAGGAAAQQDPAAAQARADAQKAAMAPLSKMDGQWRGSAWIADRAGNRTVLVQTERSGSMLDGAVRVVEGRGYQDGELAFNAFAAISYDPDKKTYSMRSYTKGYQGDFPLEVTADGFIWRMPAGPNAEIRYTAVIKDGTWVEKGEYVPAGGKGMQFIELNLKRIGDTDWPAGGAVGPE